MIALALDPGVTTGLALGYLNKNKLLIACDERKFTLAELYDYLEKFHPFDTHVIYEDFQYRNQPRTGLDLTPVKMIGIIELFIEDEKAEAFKQTPAQGKGFYSDARLKNMGIYKVGKPHGRDATRHLMQWLTFGAGSQYVRIEDMEGRIELVEPIQIYELLSGGQD